MGISLKLSGNPRPCPRPRVRSHAYYPKWYEEQKNRWGEEAREQVPEVAFPSGDLSIFIRLRRKDRRVADGDNLSKSVTDALNKIVYDDDNQIVNWRIVIERGVGKENAGVDVLIQRVVKPQIHQEV